MSKILSVSPTGHLYFSLAQNDSCGEHEVNSAVVEAFSKSQSEGLLALAASRSTASWPPTLLYWREFIMDYLHKLCHHKILDNADIPAIPAPEKLDDLVLKLPPMPGAEYCSKTVLQNIWLDFEKWVHDEINLLESGVNGFLAKHLPLWQQVGRVCFHLAEKKGDNEYPFAFLATYATGLGKNARVKHQPLGKALQEYAGEDNSKLLLRLLKPIHKVSKKCQWVSNLLENGDIYHPLAWTSEEAYLLLKSIPELEESGLVTRLPNWWQKRSKPQVQVSIGNTKQSMFNADTLLDFELDVVLGEHSLSPKEIEQILDSESGLVLLKGQWVEVDKEKLQEALEHWKSVQSEVGEGGLSFVEGMRLLSGANQDLSSSEMDEETANWAYVQAGDWLVQILQKLREPEFIKSKQPGKELKATLRPYQAIGANWLHFLSELGLGACLADDMGLGKTIQVITLLLMRKKQKKSIPSLLILPASLLGNWKSELKTFAPSLKPLFLHGAELSKKKCNDITSNPKEHLSNIDIMITTYGMLRRQEWITEQSWDLVILDEAQAIKNSLSRQSKVVKSLKGKAKIALTGTPIENHMGDLWSLFDFLCPGLLGSSSRFKNFVNALGKQEEHNFAPLRKLVQPYILRRLKTDTSIITDLPDKTEMVKWCGLTKEQATLYNQSVKELSRSLAEEEGIKRRGLILAYLTRFKQICNHPSQLLGDGEYTPKKSGKFAQLREICEEIAARQEKVLVFTQFREMTEPLSIFLTEVFNQPGLVIHGGIPVKQRKALIEKFQQETGYPFFVLSLKTAGTGLNLTRASHVIHFDRWWNPSVENQATDRAFRIGQKKNVLVHKFVCRGTLEEKINALINEKTKMAQDVLKSGTDVMLTEMKDSELIGMVSLDIERASF